MGEEQTKTISSATPLDSDERFNRFYIKIVPFVIVIPVLFLILFIIVSMLQLRDINSRIEEGKSQTIKEMVGRLDDKDTVSEAYNQFLMLANLEEEGLNERYRQGHYSLVSRSFKQYLGFFTGIIMVIVGSLFVLLKLKEQIDTSANKGEAWKFSLVTNSPGVVFGIVGAVLISIALKINDRINVSDSGVYLTREYLVAPFFSGKKSPDELNASMRAETENDGSKDTTVIIHPPK